MPIVLSRKGPLNRVIGLHDDDWRYILAKHDTLRAAMAAVGETLARPDLITYDAVYDDRRCYSAAACCRGCRPGLGSRWWCGWIDRRPAASRPGGC